MKKDCTIMEKQLKILIDRREIINRWAEYIGTQDDDDARRDLLDIIDGVVGPEILKGEIEQAIKSMKNNKVIGADKISVDSLKLLEKEGIDILLNWLVNYIYQDIFRKICKDSWFMMLPKKEFYENSTKSFIGKTKNKTSGIISQSQFGFTKSKGTRTAI